MRNMTTLKVIPVDSEERVPNSMLSSYMKALTNLINGEHTRDIELDWCEISRRHYKCMPRWGIPK